MTLYFANPCGPAVAQAMQAGELGFIDTPAQGNKRPAGVFWCADNGCFGKGWPGEDAWLRWLDKHSERELCAFATAPDVVGDAAGTLQRSLPYLPQIRQLGYPAALVAQNGLEHLTVPWDDFDVLFIGGSPECRPCAYVRPIGEFQRKHCPHCNRKLAEWKLGIHAAHLVIEARRHGKWVHMGRVNSRRRYRYASVMGCDSADGTYLVHGATKNLPTLLSWVREPQLNLIPA